MTESGAGSEVELDVEEAVASTGTAGDDPTDRDDSPGRTGAERLAEELGRTELRTTDEGYVEARVTGVEAVDDATVRLRVRLPTGRDLSFRLEKPVPWSREFLLARIVEWVGYDAATIDHLVGERILVDRARPDGSPQADAVWPEGARTGTSYEQVLSAFGLPVERADSPRWRLVDPRELDEGSDGGPGPTTKLFLAAALATVSLTAIAAVGAAVPGVLAWTVLAALAGVVLATFLLYAALLLVSAMAG